MKTYRITIEDYNLLLHKSFVISTKHVSWEANDIEKVLQFKKLEIHPVPGEAITRSYILVLRKDPHLITLISQKILFSILKLSDEQQTYIALRGKMDPCKLKLVETYGT